MKYNIIQSLPITQQDRVVMVEQSNISMYTKKIKPSDSSQVFFSHWRTTPSCESSNKIRKERQHAQKPLKRREISKVGSVKFYNYQPTCINSTVVNTNLYNPTKKEDLSGDCQTRLSPSSNNCDVNTTSSIVALSKDGEKTSIFETLNQNSKPSTRHERRLTVLSIKELLN